MAMDRSTCERGAPDMMRLLTPAARLGLGEWVRAAVCALVAAVRRPLLRHRRVLVVSFHLVIPAVTMSCAFWLRFDGRVPAREAELLWTTLPWLTAIRALTFVPFRLYEGLWRYTSLWDLRNLCAAVLVGTFACYLLTHAWFGLREYPRSVFVIDALLLLFVLGGVRLLPRLYRDVIRRGRGKRILLFGAGDAGEMIVRDMLRHRDYQPVGFLDDDPEKVGKRIHGIPVLGTREDLPRAIALARPDEVLVAISRRDLRLLRDLVYVLEPFKVPITTVPALRHVIDGKVTVGQIRSVSIEELLPRAPIGLDPGAVQALIEGKRVLVTGAGGSIGSELCRQIAGFAPGLLVMFERYENSLYAIAHDVQQRAPALRTEAIVGDVTDASRLDDVLATYRPQIIVHAAAHKHVPLMEDNPCEAVKNNVIGTRRVAYAAQRRGVERFILISSDKAVNPSSVMGATKRVAELLIQTMGSRGGTRFTAVRFGNVLGSNGSVVPRFLEQIQAGGPVTVTHPEIRRYFMLIPEAVQLVLHAAALGQGHDIYVLDMGEQIRLVDLAHNLIRLSGFIPEREIGIEFIGLRPGEKLSEELAGPDEAIEPTPVEKVLRVRSAAPLDRRAIQAEIAVLARRACVGDGRGVVQQLCRLVPSFHPGDRLIQRADAAAPAPPADLLSRPAASPARAARAPATASAGPGVPVPAGVRYARKQPPEH
jgi:FlaA1/EpsC-like NDP-sugar epimerase